MSQIVIVRCIYLSEKILCGAGVGKYFFSVPYTNLSVYRVEVRILCNVNQSQFLLNTFLNVSKFYLKNKKLKYSPILRNIIIITFIVRAHVLDFDDFRIIVDAFNSTAFLK